MDKKEELTQIVAIVKKDIDQFELLYSHIVNKVYYWCYNQVKDETVAQDLTQESIIRMYQKLHTLDNPKGFYTWMYVLVRNICYDYLRSKKRLDVQFLESDDYTESMENTIVDEGIDNIPDEAYNLKETKQLIVSFVEQLPRKQREVIMLFYLEEFTTVEIAEMLDSNLATVKSTLRNGRNNLEKMILAYQEEHNVKLYAPILLPLLGDILTEHSERMGTSLLYDVNLFKPKKVVDISKYKNFIINTLFSVMTVSSVILLVFMYLQNNTETYNGKSINNQSIVDTEMLEKLQGNPYVESITHYTFPTRNETSFSILLKKDIAKEEIEIVWKKEAIPFTKKDKKLTVTVQENGEYFLVINNKKTSILVEDIDENAPEIVGLKKYEKYVLLEVNDELEQINYDTSYLLWKDTKYPITKDNKIIGEFSGSVRVYLYNDLDQYIYYEFELQ